jgi:riboflavin kinase/FMN adenylyltransferase
VATELIRGLYNISPQHQGCVVTIGNFDGVHRGHQALLARVKERAKQLQVPSLVMTFEPQPAEFFAKDKPKVPRLTRFREKFRALARSGVDKVLVLPFNQWVADLSAEQFVEQVLYQGCGAKDIIIGDDFRFGRARQGDFAFLKQISEQYGFGVEEMPTLMDNEERISSTRIRQALGEANHTLAERFLGRPYAMEGRVVHGDKLGRSFGFPTANIHLHREATPVQGIYTVRMHGLAAAPLPGVANVGTRPTVGGTRSLLEVYLFNFNQDIYGRYVCVEFCEKQRDEERYDNLDLLIQQMQKDADQARHYFKMRGEM